MQYCLIFDRYHRKRVVHQEQHSDNDHFRDDDRGKNSSINFGTH